MNLFTFTVKQLRVIALEMLLKIPRSFRKRDIVFTIQAQMEETAVQSLEEFLIPDLAEIVMEFSDCDFGLKIKE